MSQRVIVQRTDLQLLLKEDPFGTTVLLDGAHNAHAWHSTVLRFPNPLDRQVKSRVQPVTAAVRASHARVSGSNLEKGKRRKTASSRRPQQIRRCETQATSPQLFDDKVVAGSRRSHLGVELRQGSP
jgi:hypothetical protein